LWLVHQPDDVEEGINKLTIILVHMGVLYTEFP
jgi:hypothetical protein